jgi:putative tryptophan/tyrosine transport system substrate-binding protein
MPLELLSELVPRAGVTALLVNPKNPLTERIIIDVREAARAKGVQITILKAARESEIDAAFASLAGLQADAFFISRREQFVALAARHAVPAIQQLREFAAAGGLISYGPSLTSVYRLLGIYAGKILKGAKPADLPVEQPTRFEVVVNLKTAKALGLTVPPSMLDFADESSNDPPYSAEEMTCWPVSPRVGNVKNNDPSSIEPVPMVRIHVPPARSPLRT